MSGHNKWSTIKRKKGALDAKRSKIFSKIIKDITVAVKEGGPDPEANARLRLAVQNAKGANMPKDTLQRAITKASDKGTAALQEITFEGYAPHGIAVFVECLTDNNNRTVASVRSIFNKLGGNLGTNGSLSFLFERKGVFQIKIGDRDPEELEMQLIDAGAEDIDQDEEYFTVYTKMEDFANMNSALEKAGIEAESAELQRIPNNTQVIPVEQGLKVLKLVDTIEEDDDVQAVYHNLEMTEELIAAQEQA
ncbi:MAG: YebC/PmpR family DNA-binding transcriptional regulator [Synergistales bacterium]|nr:YebC/PmpR family DNA-binding transcriptional regulator [Bacteroidales bacterium]MDY6435863.1 YebC/PmpR family DNA-binding transcriptional regulator [Synergistales bacterium]MBQ6754336.1 YebC/PmpR family DNA-binding transcriptional regulator [Bacteroidales bacterium]MDY6382169.1 YebC/PmpR family DNA-binding transcriptional regulator [Bacteroidales bacterium]MDY6393469.1 YebC/PmpR family DNA-binding transcriptional regulator [Bacteroidales bacterium]